MQRRAIVPETRLTLCLSPTISGGEAMARGRRRMTVAVQFINSCLSFLSSLSFSNGVFRKISEPRRTLANGGLVRQNDRKRHWGEAGGSALRDSVTSDPC